MMAKKKQVMKKRWHGQKAWRWHDEMFQEKQWMVQQRKNLSLKNVVAE